MTSPTAPSVLRRIAIKQALRALPDAFDVADRLTGKRNLSSLTVAELEAVAQAVGLDVSNLPVATPRAPAASPAQAPQAPADVPAIVDAPAVVQDAPAALVDNAAVDAEVARILSASFSDMPAQLRALAVRAHTVVERVVQVEVERVVERVTDAPLPVAPVAPAPGQPPVVAAPAVKLLRIASAAEVFKIRTPALQRIQVAVYNDPLAPAIDPWYVFDADTLALFLLRMDGKQNILIAGPKGTGKTSLAKQVAAYLGRFFAQISFDRTSEIDPLIGQIELSAGSTYWRDGALVSAMRRPGAVILLDEPDMAKAGALAALHPVLADRSILISRTGENVAAARDVMFCAASNTTGHGDVTGTYVDRNQMDAAFRDRFSDIVLVAYPPAAAERKILSNRTGLSKAAAHILVEYARASRARADKEQDVAQGVGLRRLLAWATGLIGGINPELIFRTTVVNQHSQEEGEVLWQLYKSTVNEAALVAAVAAPESDAPSEAAPDTDVFA